MLPADTQAIFDRLCPQAALKKFVLVGGSALALRIKHRLSEDLDFLYLANRLPRRLIDNIVADLRSHAKVELFENLADRQDFENAGLDLDDYQQDYMVNGKVKLSFFTLDNRQLEQQIRTAPIAQLNTGHLRVADLPTLFLLKSAVLARRIFTRDLYDLYVLLQQHGFSGMQFWLGLEQAGLPVDTIANRLRHAKRRSDDPGLQGLLPNPPDFERLQAFFAATLDEVEVALAAEAAR